MTSHRDSHTITDVKPEIIPGVQTGNGMPHDKYNICGIDHVCTNRKDNIFMQRQLVQNFGNRVEEHREHVEHAPRTPKVFPRNTQGKGLSKSCLEHGSWKLHTLFATSNF